jgi:hypothetical protein
MEPDLRVEEDLHRCRPPRAGCDRHVIAERSGRMKVLVTAATKYGATGEIAAAIGAVLREHGLDSTVGPPEEATTVDALRSGP